jgi:hypothetical protein
MIGQAALLAMQLMSAETNAATLRCTAPAFEASAPGECEAGSVPERDSLTLILFGHSRAVWGRAVPYFATQRAAPGDNVAWGTLPPGIYRVFARDAAGNLSCPSNSAVVRGVRAPVKFRR